MAALAFGKVLSQGRQIPNIKAVSLMLQMLW